jgi:protein gp37
MGMQRKGGISWCDATWGVLVGCTKVSAGCRNCWAEKAARLHYNASFPTGWDGTVQMFPDRLMEPNHYKKARRIAVGLMGDIFHTSVPRHFLDQLWATMGCCDSPDLRHLTFQILTKRPAEMLSYAKSRESSGMVFNLPNLWLGVSCENQATADERIPLLLQAPAAVRWVSAEPLLSGLILRDEWMHLGCRPTMDLPAGSGKLDWVIVGGESGPGARPMHPDWVRSIVKQCKSASIPVHVKQIHLNGKLSKNPTDWPEDLRVREFPEVRTGF